jgi:hypothetical protein
MFTKREPQWHAESGQDFDLREYDGGQPTGRVANIRVLGDRVDIPGRHTVLVDEGRRVTIVGREGAIGVRMRIPLQSFVDAQVHNEPGVARLRLDLVIRLGPAVVTVPLWFDAAVRSELDYLVDRIQRQAPPSGAGRATAQPVPDEPVARPAAPVVLPLLDVRVAPSSDDWLVFRPGRCSREVLRRVEPR